MMHPEPERPAEAPFLGVGVGLRPAHYAEVVARGPAWHFAGELVRGTQ
jgi:hypothetical protein